MASEAKIFSQIIKNKTPKVYFKYYVEKKLKQILRNFFNILQEI